MNNCLFFHDPKPFFVLSSSLLEGRKSLKSGEKEEKCMKNGRKTLLFTKNGVF
jgi:hypothetical protein